MKLPKIFTNIYFLYFVVFLSITNLIGYLTMGNLNALVYFILAGVVTAFFSKNMIVILLSALIISNIFIAGQSVSEGFTSDSEMDPSGNVTNKPTTTPGNLPMTPVSDDTVNEPDVSNTNTNVNLNTDSENNYGEQSGIDEAFHVGMENKNKGNYRVDYASTIEDAYGQLNQILGSEGIKRLTQDTQNLLKQQVQLADAMKSMGPLISNMAPLIEQTKGLMNGIGGFDIKNLGSFASLAKGFSPAA